MGASFQGAKIFLPIVEQTFGTGLVKMSLWVDKYRPTNLQKLDYHKELASHLKKLVSEPAIACRMAETSVLLVSV